MATIKAANQINGIHGSLHFVDGVAETSDQWLIEWFKEHGYEVTDDTKRRRIDDDDPRTEIRNRKIY